MVIVIIVGDFYFDIATEQEISNCQGHRHAQTFQTGQEDAGKAEKNTIHFVVPPFESALTGAGGFTERSFDIELLFW